VGLFDLWKLDIFNDGRPRGKIRTLTFFAGCRFWLGVPLYEYELCGGSCTACGGRFTLRRPLDAPELKQCPACRKPVRKIISLFNTPTHLKPVSVSDAKKAGFTVLKRVTKGEYERQ